MILPTLVTIISTSHSRESPSVVATAAMVIPCLCTALWSLEDLEEVAAYSGNPKKQDSFLHIYDETPRTPNVDQHCTSTAILSACSPYITLLSRAPQALFQLISLLPRPPKESKKWTPPNMNPLLHWGN